MQAKYRGLYYNIEDHKKECSEWYFNTHSTSSEMNVYRGIAYNPNKDLNTHKSCSCNGVSISPKYVYRGVAYHPCKTKN